MYAAEGPGRARRASPTPTARAGGPWPSSPPRPPASPSADAGTLVVINGPRFSSRAESLWHQQAGWTVVGMTGMPEASIARELAMCFTTIALVTDHDAGVEGGEAVTHEEVLRVFAENVDGLKQAAALGARRDARRPRPTTRATCACRRALDGLALPFALPA